MEKLMSFCLLPIVLLGFSQDAQIKVEKLEGKSGYYFKLRYQDNGKELENNIYDLDGFDQLEDRVKLQFIDKLLAFEGDTSIYVNKPYPWYVTNNARNRYFTPKSAYQTTEVNALYFINRIAFDYYTDYYAPAPVLFDNELGIEINDDPAKIKAVFAAYKEWFEKCKAAGKISKYFPFNSGRYVWLFGQESKFPMDDFLKECSTK